LFARKNGSKFVFASAKTGLNVEQTFVTLVNEILS